MFRSYFFAALRNFRKNKFHTIINVFGLGLGITASLLALMFVLDELSFDSFHTKIDRIYRLNKISTENDGSTFLNAESSGLMGPTMVSEFPEVESVVRYQPWNNIIVFSNQDRNFQTNEREALFVDSTFFDVFDFKLIRGNPKTVLTRPLTIVLTETMASSLFGDQDPIGKTITGINGLEFEVTGIAKPAPRNSHIQYKALISWTTTVPQVGPLAFTWMNNWIAQAVATYVLVKPGADVTGLQAKFPKFMQDHMPTRVDVYQLYLQPLRDVYLGANIKYQRTSKSGNLQYIYLFSIIAGFILFIACINYININTSRSARRAREVGMRKSLGATRSQLIKQFLGESFVVTALSFGFAILLLYFSVPLFNNLAGKSISYDLLLNPRVVTGGITLIIFVSIVSGLYPAVVLAAFRPSEVLKGSTGNHVSGHLPRHILITFQFTIAIIMIAGTLLVYQQMEYILSKDLGFDKEHVLVLSLTNDMIPKGETFQHEVSQHPSVVSTTLAKVALGLGSSSTYVVPEGFPPDEIEIRMFPADGNFKNVYGLEMAMGRFFDLPAQASDSGSLVINEALMRRLKWDDPTKKTIKFNEGEQAYPVIGVLKDFNFHSLYEEVGPMVMWIQPANRRHLSIRFQGNPGELLSFLESKWKSFEARYPFQYYFVDQEFAKSYQSDDKLYKTIVTFSGLSIVIACLGLYGLVSYTLEQRTREFGVRKVLGATITGLTLMVNRKFVLMVMLAGVLSVPVIIPLMSQWLSRFAFRIEIGPGTFLFAILITLAVSVLAVSIQAIKAAMMNPAEALRHE